MNNTDGPSRQDEITQLCMLYDKRVLAQELMIAYDQIALLQEFITEQTKKIREELNDNDMGRAV